MGGGKNVPNFIITCPGHVTHPLDTAVVALFKHLEVADE